MALMPGQARAAYERMAAKREPFLERARDASRLTIPHLITDEGHFDDKSLPTPYQSVGSRGVNNLSSKLLVSLFPPSEPFFRFEADLFPVQEAAGEEAVEEIEQSLQKVVVAVSREVEGRGLRPSLYEVFRHLVVAGNVLWYLPRKRADESRCYKLDQFVVERDPEGSVLLIIIRERVNPALVKDKVGTNTGPMDGGKVMSGLQSNEVDSYGNSVGSEKDVSQEEPVEVFTVIQRKGKDRYEGWQEWKSEELPGTRGSWSAKNMPYLPLRMNRVSGEHFGRGIVEEHLGDLISLEGLWTSIVHASVEAARVVHFTRPGATVTQQEYASAETGEVLTGEEGDVYTHQLNKYPDLRVAYEAADRIERRLDQAFLMGSTIQRNAERVTAEEIRFLVRELEEALGGAYAVLAQELQLPVVEQVMSAMQSEGRLPPIPREFVQPSVITGVEALGRGQEFDRMVRFASAGQAAVGPEAFAQQLNARNWLQRLAVQAGIRTENILRSEEEIAAERQQAMQMQALQTPAAAQGVKGVADAIQAQQAQLPPPQ